VKVPGSDDWWLVRLLGRLGAQFPHLKLLRDEYDGVPEVIVGDDATQQTPEVKAFTAFRNASRLNIARLIVQAPTSRMVPLGARTSVAGDEASDKIVQDIFDEAHMYSQLPELFTDMGVYGSGFLLAGDDALVRLSPWKAITAASETQPWAANAGLFISNDPTTDMTIAVLFIRDDDGLIYVRVAHSEAKGMVIPDDGRVYTPDKRWAWQSERTLIPWADEIPLIRVEAPGAVGQFEPHVAALDRINTLLFNRTVIMVLQAFKQRYTQGKLPKVYPKGHPLEGQTIDYRDLFKLGPAALITLPPDMELHQLDGTDTNQFTNAIAQELKNVAAVTGTPLYMLVPDAVQGSATGASIARETLVTKTSQLIARAQDGIARSIWLRAQAEGRPVAGKIRVAWAPVDTTSMSEKAQSASLAGTTLPLKTIWREVYQFTPEQMEQAELDLDDQQFSGVTQQFGGTGASLGSDGLDQSSEPAGESDRDTGGDAGGSPVGAVAGAAD
jgi:hypothetical protein